MCKDLLFLDWVSIAVGNPPRDRAVQWSDRELDAIEDDVQVSATPRSLTGVDIEDLPTVYHMACIERPRKLVCFYLLLHSSLELLIQPQPFNFGISVGLERYRVEYLGFLLA